MKQERARRFGGQTRMFSSNISGCIGDARALAEGGCYAEQVG